MDDGHGVEVEGRKSHRFWFNKLSTPSTAADGQLVIGIGTQSETVSNTELTRYRQVASNQWFFRGLR